jgi:hypothetical protein
MHKNDKPYRQEVSTSGVIKRTFDTNIDPSELVWHRDKRDRVVTPTNENDWMIQFDNELPKKLVIGESITIPKESYHRVIKGSGDLIVEIEEFDSLEEAKKKKPKRDACYYKVKSRYSVWPSAYGSGSLVQCRKVGAKNWGNKSEGTDITEDADAVNEISDFMHYIVSSYKNERIVMSHEDKIIFKPTPIDKQRVGPKPRGFWYGFGSSWLDWVRSEMPDWETDYVHLVKVNDSRILKISTFDELLAFTEEFGVKGDYAFGGSHPKSNINWAEVAKRYSGIEINPYISKGRMKFMWYYPWDVASGCVWGEDGIVSIELLDEDEIERDFDEASGKSAKVEEKTDYSKEKKKGLHGWFERRGGEGSQGWVDCNTCKKDPETGRKKCKPCGRKEGEKRSKYPACRPTPSACKTKDKGEKWGKKSENTVYLIRNLIHDYANPKN